MKASVSRMQGTPASIEFHYEALAYCKREKKLCHFMVLNTCKNNNSSNFMKRCIGYNKCTEFTSEDRYYDKVGRAARKEQKRKKLNSGFPSKSNSNPKYIMSTEKKTRVKQSNTMSENALGNDPRFAALFDQFREDN